MARDWHLYQGGQKKGPFSWQELCQQARVGLIKPCDQIWAEGMAKWAKASEIKGLLPVDAPIQVSQPTPQHQPFKVSPPPVSYTEPPAVPVDGTEYSPCSRVEHFSSFSPAAPLPSPQGKRANLIVFLTLLAVIMLGLFMIFGGINFFISEPDPGHLTDSSLDEASQVIPEIEPDTIDPVLITGLDADYYIDYNNGTIPLSELPIGARVVDPSWEWEFKMGVNYSDYDVEGNPTGVGEIKPVTWIVVAIDHYDGIGSHVTLLSEELIGKYSFDNSTNREHEYAQYGYNHWGDSGNANATYGLRPWLNSTGIHSGEGFYQAFSESFKNAVLNTTLPNKEWKNGTTYSTNDRVFLPSTTELGDSAHNYTYPIGLAFPYFSGVGNAERTAFIGDEAWEYWMRSPDSRFGSLAKFVFEGFEFYGSHAYFDDLGVLPALNLRADVMVSEIEK